jgi:hypothetical protein
MNTNRSTNYRFHYFLAILLASLITMPISWRIANAQLLADLDSDFQQMAMSAYVETIPESALLGEFAMRSLDPNMLSSWDKGIRQADSLIQLTRAEAAADRPLTWSEEGPPLVGETRLVDSLIIGARIYAENRINHSRQVTDLIFRKRMDFEARKDQLREQYGEAWVGRVIDEVNHQ